MDRLRILTWHVHGSYLASLARLDHEIFLPRRDDGSPAYGGLGSGRSWPASVHEVPADEVRNLEFDVIVFQSKRNYEVDQHEILTPAQRRLPRVFLEHDPPREHPTDTRHHVDDPNILLVHVTHFNRLMWDADRTPTTVIEHGVAIPDGIRYTGELERGITAINELRKRGRRLGADIFALARSDVPLDLVGMDSAEIGGLGEIPPEDLAAFEARYRFYFNPVRYTSLPLAVVEAMSVGMPIVALATTELPIVIENGVNGFIHADPDKLVEAMQLLLVEPDLARQMGEAARATADERFGIERFTREWDEVLRLVVGQPMRRWTRRRNGTGRTNGSGNEDHDEETATPDSVEATP